MNSSAGSIETTVKLSFKRHAMPPLVGVFLMLSMLGVFNSQFIAAKVQDVTYQPPTVSTPALYDEEKEPTPPAVGPDQPPEIAIENIGVDAPVIYGLTTIDEVAFQRALQDGVVHYPGTALPGEQGNAVIFGHSSGQVWAPGDYKFVFTHLEKLNKGDNISLTHKGINYTYRITGMKVVPPTDVSVLMSDDDKNTLTLITCTPVGTNDKRFIVIAEQVDPKPATSTTEKTETNRPNTPQVLPGNNESSVWESFRSIF